jgi:ribosome-associated heat shock protein Hsp15
MPAPSLRIDRLLWFLRLAPSRSMAQSWVEAGHIRVNGARVTKTAQPVRDGDVLTLPMRTHVRVIELIALPQRRGPASEAVAHYRELTPRPLESDSQHSEVIDGGAPSDLGTVSES